MTDARVILWGRDIGAVSWDANRELGVFQYAPEFVDSRIELAPLMMPLQTAPYVFPTLPRESFSGLPGLLADSLPDKFGNALIDAWLARQGRTSASFNPVERLCYIGARGMGALEFQPALLNAEPATHQIDVERLVALANEVLNQRMSLKGTLTGTDDSLALEDILRVGTSAGGARAKAILAWNETTGEFRSGQLPTADGFGLWLMKFDGISANRDKELADPQGFGRIEYAYSKMALAAGIDMTECRLYEEGDRAHFMTRRFDRSSTGRKLHMQSLAAMLHFDFNAAGVYSYEQALQCIRHLELPRQDIEQQFLRAVFNVSARNQDDHVKNIAFLMNQRGEWRLSPAFDVAYSYNPNGAWTARHQMTIVGKSDDFTTEDLLTLARAADIKTARAKALIDNVQSALQCWEEFAHEACVSAQDRTRIAATFRRFT